MNVSNSLFDKFLRFVVLLMSVDKSLPTVLLRLLVDAEIAVPDRILIRSQVADHILASPKHTQVSLYILFKHHTDRVITS